MNKEEILGLKPGRETDDLLLEWVMGWEAVAPQRIGDEWSWKDDKGHRRYDFEPSTNYMHALEVLEKFSTYQVSKMSDVVWASDNRYRVIIKKNRCVAYAETAPLAICRAALLVAMLEEDGIE